MENQSKQQNSHLYPLLLVLLFELAMRVLDRLNEAQRLPNYGQVLLLTIVGTVVIYIVAWVASHI